MPNNREPDTDSGDSTEPESDSETEQAQMTQTTPYSQFPSQPEPFSSTDEEDEDSDSESDPTRITSNGARKPRSMLTSAAGQLPEEENGTDGKKLKGVEPEASEKKSTPLWVWRQDDAIVILKGMVDYSAKKKADPVAELDSFLQSIKKNLHFGLTRTQLQDKIRKLKGKYEANKKKGREMILPNLHEQTAYELSKCIWGKKDNENEGGNLSVNAKANESVVRRPPSKRKADDRAFSVEKRAKTVEKMVMSMGDKLFKTGEEGEEWNKLKLEDMKTYLRHLEVKTKQTKLVIDSLKSGVF